MKKTILLSIIACAMFSPAGMLAQKKGKKQVHNVKGDIPVVITNDSDSTSYIFGVAMSQGLDSYLMQMGTLADTASVVAPYDYKISSEKDETKKAVLLKEKIAKVDSIKTANAASLKEFMAGFSQAFGGDKSKEAFNTGVSIAGQVKKSTESFSNEMMENVNDFKTNIFLSAFFSSLKGEKPLIEVENPQEEMQKLATVMQERKQKSVEEALRLEYKDEIEVGEKFLAENKAKEGVVTLPSGLQYKILAKGDGAIPTKTDIVKVHYKGSLLDGSQFDSSYDRGEPTSFSAGHVITGWTEALTLMPVGSKWELYIPYDLAYGARDQGVIKPFSTLIFEVELLDTTPAAEMEKRLSADGE